MKITVTVIEAKGSVPRNVGAQMIVSKDGQNGSIGGGALEFEAIAHARRLLAGTATEQDRSFALGPALGQCCGGSLRLRFSPDAPPRPKNAPLWIWGAGHVGRALCATLAPLERYAITVIDSRMPFLEAMPEDVGTLFSASPALAVPHAPQEAMHLVLTHSHEIDLALCDGLLRHGFSALGLIGSATKWARFRKRLGEMGHQTAEIERICCPIGDPTLGKHPQAIAVGVAAALLAHNGLAQRQEEPAG